MAICAVIFDMDGTLLDTEKLYRRFWVEAAQQMGYPMTDAHALAIRSMAPRYAEPLLRKIVCPEFDYHGVRALRRQLMGAYTDKHGVDPKPGLLETLSGVRAKGMRIGLATATPEERARQYLRQVGAEDYFDAVTSATMVTRGKPAPDVYLLAAERLGISPEEAVAVEDAPTGIRAAYDAGLRAVMIPDQTEPDAQTRELCTAIIRTLPELLALV